MKQLDLNKAHILISRTDSIGDVMLTLPTCAWLKTTYPGCTISFLGKSYTQEILKNYPYIDHIYLYDDWQDLSDAKRLETIKQAQFDVIVHVFPRKDIAKWAKQAKIPMRIGTSHRLFHLLLCNVRPNFTRKNSTYHEAQLNFELLKPLGVKELPNMEQLNEYTLAFGSNLRANIPKMPFELKQPYVILHPKSQGSAREWPIEKYIALSKQLLERGYHCYFTGTEKEGALFRNTLPNNPSIIDTTGQLNMEQLLYLIQQSAGLVACSTGPLHLAGFLQRKAIGLFIVKRPMHPGRWKPLGEHATTLVYDENCNRCSSKEDCLCIADIPVERVLDALLS